MQASLETVTVEDSIGRYMVDIASATRDHPQVLVGASPRGSLALMLLSRARAALDGRDYVIPEDVKRVAKAGAGPPAHPASPRCGCAGSIPVGDHRRRAGRDAGPDQWRAAVLRRGAGRTAAAGRRADAAYRR